MTFDQRINRPANRAKRQPSSKRGPYECAGLTRDIKAYRRAYYLARKEKGLCAQCGRPNDRENKTQCSKCCRKKSTL